jgi:protein ATS1
MPPHALFSAGSNAKGQLATGDTEDVHSFTACSFVGCREPGTLPAGTHRILNVACGANHTLLLLEREPSEEFSYASGIELWGAGDGSRGQLGPSVTSSTNVFHPLEINLDKFGLGGSVITHVAVCWETTYVAVHSPGGSDVLLSMGADDFGDLGIGGLKAKGKTIDGGVHIVNLQDAFVQGDARRMNIVSLVSGPHHIVVRLATLDGDGQPTEILVGWGTSRHGQLGDQKDPTKGRPIPFIPAPKSIPLQHDDNSKILQVAAGTHHTVILRSSGRVLSLGSNRKGQITSLEELRNVSDIGCTWNGTYALVRREDSWSIVSTGNSAKGQLGRRLEANTTEAHTLGHVCFPFSHTARGMLKMVCGSEHVLAVTRTMGNIAHNEVWGWGWNEHGNLGIGHMQDQPLPVKLWPSTEAAGCQLRIVDIWAGCGTSWILLGN